MQSVHELPPSMLLYPPEGHALQEDADEPVKYAPISHFMQIALDIAPIVVPNVPREHPVQAKVCIPEAELYVPAEQFKSLSQLLAPEIVTYFPAEQRVHMIAFIVEAYVPALQKSHVVFPNTLVYVP